MKSRPFYKWKSPWIGVLVLAMVVLAIVFVPGRGELNARRRARSPGGEFMAIALPFSGPGSQGRDGGLVIYLAAGGRVIDKHRTSLQATRRTRLEWIAGASPESFRVWDEQGTRMVWRVDGWRAVCVEGVEFLLPETEKGEE
jgi:hypothetical protein